MAYSREQLMSALRNADNAGDTDGAKRIASMIQSQPQEPVAPTGAATPQQDNSNYIGDTLAGMGRIAAGAVSDVANVGVGAYNTLGSGIQSISNSITGENAQFTPMATAGYGDSDFSKRYLTPQGTGEQVVAALPSYMIGGELVAPVKAAENAGRVVRASTAILNQLPASIAGELSEHNQGNLSGANIAVNAALPSVVEKVGGAAVRGVRGVLPEGYGGYTTAQKAAEVVDPYYLNDVLQYGDQDAQNVFRTATTDPEGNSILNPSQVFNTDGGAKYIRAEQRDLTRGDQAYYAPNVAAQKTGESVGRAIDEIPAAVGNDLSVQDAAKALQSVHKERLNRLYNNNREAAQNIIDSAPVKITELKFPETKMIAQDHLDKSTESGNVLLNAETRKTLNSFNNAKIGDLNTIDQWKRTLSEKAQKAYRNGDYTSYQALNQVKNNLRSEADDVVHAIDPNAASIYDDADKYFAGTVEGYGKKSELQKLVNSEFGETAADKLFNRNTGFPRTERLFNQLQLGQSGTFDATRQYTNDLASALGQESRARAYDYATTGEHFSPTKFGNRLYQNFETVNAADRYSPREETNLNMALHDVASRLKPSNAANVGKGVVNPIIANASGRLTGAAIGSGIGSVLGGGVGSGVGLMIGQHVGGEVGSSIAGGLLDRLMGTNRNATKYIQFLSDPANAQAVSDVLANQGGLNAPVEAITRTVDALSQSGYSALSNRTVKPTYQAPAPIEQEPARDIPEQHAQAATQFEPKVTKLYKALAHAETGGLSDRFIRTKAAEAGTSTAYGAAQLTVSTAKDFYQRHGDIFTPEEKDYLHRFFDQGETMKRASDNDPVYGYGGSGVLNGKADRKLYANVVRKMLNQMIKDNGGSLDKTVKQWRGADDRNYFSKVRAAYRAA